MAGQDKNRPDIVSLTTLRGYLAAWVALGHFWDSTSSLLPECGFLSPFPSAGHMAVPAFFLLSGWVMTFNYFGKLLPFSVKEFKRFLLLRLSRVYPVHLVTLLSVGLLAIAGTLSGHPLSSSKAYGATDFVLNLLLIHSWLPFPTMSWNYPSWSISVEWFLYLLFPAILFVLHRFHSIKGGLLVWLAGTTIAALACVFYWPPWPFHSLVLSVPLFSLGAGLCLLIPVLGRSRLPKWLPDALLAGMFAATFIPSERAMFATLIVLPVLLVGSLLERGHSSSWLWNNRPSRWLGEVSYSLYLVHAVAAKVLVGILPAAKFAGENAFVRIAVFVTWVVVVLASTWLCYSLVEKPARGGLRRFVDAKTK